MANVGEYSVEGSVSAGERGWPTKVLSMTTTFADLKTPLALTPHPSIDLSFAIQEYRSTCGPQAIYYGTKHKKTACLMTYLDGRGDLLDLRRRHLEERLHEGSASAVVRHAESDPFPNVKKLRGCKRNAVDILIF